MQGRTGNRAVGDLWGGLAAAAVLLPQAMAFGVALYAAVGLDPARGALTGLVATACLSLLSGLSGGTAGLVSAPTGPVLVLTIGGLDAGAGGASGALAGLAAITVIAGLVQVAIALSGGGRLVKLLPYPVVAGFMTGSAVLMILSQVKPLAGGVRSPGGWIPLVTALVTLAATLGLPHLLRWLPGAVSGLLIGGGLFHLLSRQVLGSVPDAWVVGVLPRIDSLTLPLGPSTLAGLAWTPVLIGGVTLGLLASLDTLLTSVIADTRTGERHRAGRELIGQGLGQVLAGGLGGMAGAGTTGATVVATDAGGRRWAGALVGVSFACLLLWGGAIGRWIPISALAGIILAVALLMVERDLWAWLRRRKTRLDAFIALLVTGVTVGYDLMVAVGLGVLIAVVLYLRQQVRQPVIHRRRTAREWRSTLVRSAAQRALLEEHGDRIVIYELRGALFFATADHLYGELLPDLDRPAWVILHMRRVTHADLTAIKILEQIARRLQAAGGQLVVCNLHGGIGLGRKIRKTLRKVSVSGEAPAAKTRIGSDEALAYAENELLAELGQPEREPEEADELADMDLCQGLSPEQLGDLDNRLGWLRAAHGEALFAAGDHGDSLLFVMSGRVEIRLPTTEHHHKRLARYGPGAVFGEIALLAPGPRAAGAYVTRDAVLRVLDRDALDRLVAEAPALGAALLERIGLKLGEELRWSARELMRLAEW